MTDPLMPAGRPDAEAEIDEQLIRQLLRNQHPDLSTLPITPLASGWDNVMFRLGERLTVRLPRRSIAAELIENEQRWLPKLAPLLPLAISAPIRTGTRTEFFPWSWSILPFFDGETADLATPAGNQSRPFADFLLALHQPAPADAPANPVRGVPLSVRIENTEQRLARLTASTSLINQPLLDIWEAALQTPETSHPVWLHGDLHAQNVLTLDGTLSAVIDWGDITAGDPATDLAGAWSLFDRQADRENLLARYNPSESLLKRARGWAFLFAVVLTDSGLINSPQHARAGQRMLKRLEADA